LERTIAHVIACRNGLIRDILQAEADLEIARRFHKFGPGNQAIHRLAAPRLSSWLRSAPPVSVVLFPLETGWDVSPNRRSALGLCSGARFPVAQHEIEYQRR